MTTVVTALTNQLTLQDNMSCAINQLTFVATATANTNNFTFVWPYPRQPIMLMMRATRSDGTTPPIYVTPSWYLSNGNIVVNGIDGLTNGVSYGLTTVVI